MEFSVPNLCGFLIRSRLLSGDEVKAIQQRWLDDSKAAASDADDVGQFAKWLVAQQYVTEYQASLLARGLPDNFFLGQYKILERLGQGGMAGVYKAAHSLGQVVAIKVLPPSKARHPKIFGRFQREARFALKLKHPNIVRAFQIGQANGLHYIAMEYLDGETLQEVLKRRGKLPPAEAARLVHQALMGLQHIHENGLIHRDLKPANLMLLPAPAPGQPDNTLQATVKILDIGLGKALFDESVSDPAGNEGLTSEGALLGTPDYLSPEQARNAHTVDIRADIYSLGCVLYHTLTGRPPFPDTNVITQMVRHLTETPRPLKEFNPAVPEGLQQIVNWMMAKDPAQRYPTPERAAQALQVFMVAGTGPLRTPESDPKTKLFLSYLEKAGNEQEEAPPDTRAQEQSPKPAASVPVVEPILPVAQPVTAPVLPLPVGKLVAASPKQGRPTPAPASKRRGKKKRHHRAHAEPVPMAAGAADQEVFDVELIPVEPPAVEAVAIRRRYGLSRRDLLLLACGAGGLTAAVGLGYAVTAWLGKSGPEKKK